jgi:hypothetical protein
MGSTLTHGVYLPDEGERNCYDGLAANWQLLDGAVGTIAEHTTALSDKAPLVHTHSKSDITDFPAFGTTAGTICEGNDSRLSDARTPVAHTHTKSDVTDLLNSNFIPSANNSYNLGSSSYQWNNVYSKSYYYNGTPWGLDKYNQWTGVNDFNDLIGLNNAELWFKHPNIEDITTNPSTNTSKSILQIWNKATTQYCGGIIDGLMTDGTHKLTISCLGFPLHNYGGYYPHSFSFEAKRDGTASFSPNYTNASLGTSTNQWKTLNGINPGALNLPDYSHPLSLDVTAQGLNWHTDATPNFYEIPANGYFAVIVQCPNISNGVLDIFVNNTGIGSSDHGTYAGSELFCYVPVIKGVIVRVRARCDKYYSVAFYPCLGNV